VVEGWHGVPYGKPVTRAREYVDIMRQVWKREAPVQFHGEHYDIPISGGSGLGKPLKLIIHPQRPSIPIYLAAIGPKNVALAAEVADGWLPILFSPERMSIYREWLDEGFAKADPAVHRPDFDIAPTVQVVIGDDLEMCRNMVKPFIALYVGGMGARDKNFYFNLACRYGYEEAANQIQDLYLTGRKGEAAMAVPDQFVDEVALCGPRERVAERLSAWKSSGIGTMICGTWDVNALRTMAELVL